jgi:hypothetical protein
LGRGVWWGSDLLGILAADEFAVKAGEQRCKRVEKA